MPGTGAGGVLPGERAMFVTTLVWIAMKFNAHVDSFCSTFHLFFETSLKRCELMRDLLYLGTSLIRNTSPPRTPLRALGMVLLKSPRGRRFLLGEVPLYRGGRHFFWRQSPRGGVECCVLSVDC